MRKFFKSNWVYILAGIGIAALYFVRFYNLTLLPVFADEAIYIRWSQIMANEPTLRFLPLSDGKQPMFMWILMFLVNRFTDPLFIGRAVSVFSGFGTMLGVGFLSYLLFKNKLAAFTSAFIYSILPFTFFFDRLGLVDSMLTMFGVWSFYFAVLTAKTRRLDTAMLMGFFLGCAWLTKSTATIFIMLAPLARILADWKRNFAKNFPLIFKALALYLVSVTIAFGMYNILRLGPNFGLIASRNQDYIYPINHILFYPLNPLRGHIGGIINYFVLMGTVGLLIIWLVSYFVNWKKYWKEMILLTFWAVVPILVTAEYFKVVTARYIVYTIPYLIILAGSSFMAKTKTVKLLVFLAAAALIVQSLSFNWKLMTNPDAAPLPAGEKTGYLLEWTAGQGIKEISEYLKPQASQLSPGEKIVVGTEGFFGTLPDGLQMYMEGNKNVVVIGVGLGFEELPTSLAESKKAGNKTYLVINKSRLIVSPEKIGLKLIASYQKPPRRPDSLEYKQFGPQDSLLFFEVK